MKYEIGDKILVLLTNEEGKVVDIKNGDDRSKGRTLPCLYGPD
jgi:hypothetical protein